MQTPEFVIRPMSRAELGITLDWAANEGWNPGLDDAEPFYQSDPGGFLVGLLNDKPIAVISVVKYADDFGFLGFYIVLPEYRGQGYGLKIWQAGMERLQGRVIGLDGVIAQQPNYQRSGFVLAHRNVRYQGICKHSPAAQADKNLLPLSALPFESVSNYDKQFFPTARDRFLQSWISQPHSHALGLVTEGKLNGYAVIRTCRSGHKIGPLFADTPEYAETLFNALSNLAPAGEAIFLDVPQCNLAAVALAESKGMQVVFETARMYRGTAPDLPLNRIFGITSFELG